MMEHPLENQTTSAERNKQMAIQVPKSKMQHYSDGSVDVTCFHAGNQTECFYCYQVIDEETYAVQWRGGDHDLWLHPGCVMELSLRLFRDVHEIECMSHEEPLRGWSSSERRDIA